MPRALVTGCAGFVGSHLTEALLADGHQVRGVDCFNDNYAAGEKLENIGASRSHDGFELHPVDLATADLDRLLEGVDVVFHLAAVAEVLDGLLDGYGGRPEALDWYLAAAILARVAHPFHRQVPGWPERVDAMLRAAERARA